MDRSPTAIFIVQLNSAASAHSDVAGRGVPTVLCPNCHTLVKVPTNFTLYRCCNCLVYLQAETPISAPLPPKDGKAVGFISSFFKKKRQINFFRRSPNYEQKLAPSPSSGLTEQSSEEEHQAMSFGLACVFPYEELKEATNGFHESRVLGGGGFGRVYLGKLKDGRRVAVKKLYDDNPKQLEQFFNEVTALSRLRHKNLVALYGCTNPQSRKKLLLVYEFIPNGTLADHLHGKRRSLPWAVRIRIAIEMAEALTYLHCLEPPIIHGDIKTLNILLDKAFQVKVADLGMCRLLPWDSTYVSTRSQGTMGYLDPEYHKSLKLTDKSDVYSFGVVLLELVSGKKAVDVNRAVDDDPYSSEIYLTSMGLNKIQNNQVELLVDPELGYPSKGEIRRMVDSVIKLAYKCLQTQGNTRPAMIEVLRALKTIEEMVKTEEATTEQSSEEEHQAIEEMVKTEEATTEQSSEEEHQAMKFGLACIFPYEELMEATNGFHKSQELGGGGFSRVYLGELKDGRSVAVKKLYDDNPNQLEQFFNEVTILSRHRHKNLVALYGCTYPESRKKLLLVYEFIPNGTLADHLHGKRRSLPWAVRIRIAIEMAEALKYLHSLELPIIHRDIKTLNILLDNAFQVKVADLGMCRLLPWDSTYVSTRSQGTLGYLDPEYHKSLKLTDKSDVYSFGVVLLELVSGKQAVDVNRAVDDNSGSIEIYLTGMGLNMIQNNQVELLVDPELGYHSKGEIRRMVDSVIKLACKCLQTQGNTRPRMIEVLRALKTIEEMVKTDDLQKNNVTPEINQTSTTHPPTQIIETKMENKRRPIEAAREVAFSGLNNILYESKIELGEAYTSSSLPSNSGLIVYQGKLTDGRTVKAFKGYNSNRMEEFYKVVNSHSTFCHQNLVTLYGLPDQGSRELLLVYELLPNGTLEDHLLGKHVAKGALNLDVSIQIAIDTAQALVYLHSFDPPVVHGRVKTDTILLDDNFSAKIVDLGLCHLLPSENEQLSAKLDVYSFGMVLRQLSTGDQAVDIHREWEDDYKTFGMLLRQLREWEDDYKKLKQLSEMVGAVTNLAQLSFRCSSPNENNRPHMKEALSILEGLRHKIVDLGLGHLLPSENEQLSAKLDVYSFGTVLRKLSTGNQAVDIHRECEDIYKKLKQLSEIMGAVTTLAQLSFRCSSPNENNRPHMKEVLSILKGLRHKRATK